MPYSDKKVHEIASSVAAIGLKETALRYNIQEVTVTSAVRRCKSMGKMVHLPKILLLDVETAPMDMRGWHTFKPIIPHTWIMNESNIICWRAKWLYSTEIMGGSQTAKEAKKRDDKPVLRSIHKLMNEAEIIIGHNVEKFDVRVLNTRFIINGYGPNSPYQTIDTLTSTRNKFRHPSNKLDYLSTITNRKSKLQTDNELWDGCLKGDQQSLDYMYKYCGVDVEILEEYYLFIRAWIKNHPNLALYLTTGENVCHRCLSNKLTLDGEYVTTVNRFNAYRCECGGYTRDRKSNLNVKEREKLLAPLNF